jgi:plasmid stabilization system protein ParE
MSSRYVVRPAAHADIEAIVDYLRERNPLAAVRFVEAAQATFEYLADMPRAYPCLGWEDPRLADMRHRADPQRHVSRASRPRSRS